MMKSTLLLAGCICAALLLPITPEQSTARPPAPAVEIWVKASAHPLTTIEPGSPWEDLAPLGEAIGDAELVLLGESRHDAHEHFVMKHRLIEYLVATRGFTLLAMEESLPCVAPINEWILGGPGDPLDLVNGMSAWFIWSTEEMLTLVQWLRRWNDDPTHIHKVRFYGIDTMDPLPAIAELQRYLKRVDPPAAALLTGIPLEQFSKRMWPITLTSYGELSEKQLTAIDQGIAELRQRLLRGEKGYITRSSAAEYRWHLRLVVNLEQAHQFFARSRESDFLTSGHVREQGMTDNLLWLRRQHHPGEKIILWAHNLHVGRDSFDLDIPNRPPTAGMIPLGCRLARELGDEMVAIGFSFGERVGGDHPLPPADTVDGVMAGAGLPLHFVDLRRTPPGPVHDWFNSSRGMRAEGGWATLIPARAYDLILFTGELTETRATEGAQR